MIDDVFPILLVTSDSPAAGHVKLLSIESAETSLPVLVDGWVRREDGTWQLEIPLPAEMVQLRHPSFVGGAVCPFCGSDIEKDYVKLSDDTVVCVGCGTLDAELEEGLPG